jgi:hypothetical protein
MLFKTEKSWTNECKTFVKRLTFEKSNGYKNSPQIPKTLRLWKLNKKAKKNNILKTVTHVNFEERSLPNRIYISKISRWTMNIC